jgi:hypothetical protein
MKTTLGKLRQIIMEATGHQAAQDLKTYAKAFNLQIFVGPDEIADQMSCDQDDLPPGIEAGAFFPDVTVMQCAAFVANEGLCRFGDEKLGEDPSDIVYTTLAKLMARGDPRYA